MPAHSAQDGLVLVTGATGAPPFSSTCDCARNAYISSLCHSDRVSHKCPRLRPSFFSSSQCACTSRFTFRYAHFPGSAGFVASHVIQQLQEKVRLLVLRGSVTRLGLPCARHASQPHQGPDHRRGGVFPVVLMRSPHRKLHTRCSETPRGLWNTLSEPTARRSRRSRPMLASPSNWWRRISPRQRAGTRLSVRVPCV